jgi:hypothetical protein
VKIDQGSTNYFDDSRLCVRMHRETIRYSESKYSLGIKSMCCFMEDTENNLVLRVERCRLI